MSLNEALAQKNITKYRLWKESGVPQATISDICTDARAASFELVG